MITNWIHGFLASNCRRMGAMRNGTMMSRTLLAVAFLTCANAIACATADSSKVGTTSPSDGGVESGAVESGTDAVTVLDTGIVDGEFDGLWCGGEVQPAELIPLDLYIMLDASGSMSREVSGTWTKWDAVGQALGEFVADASMDGLNLGLQFFPFLRPGVPETCAFAEQCQGFGPCVQPRICDNHYFSGNVVTCTSADDCVSGQSAGSCLVQGTCLGDSSLVCLPEFESACKNNLGDCLVVSAYCEGRQSCDILDYASPAVPMGPRKDVADAIGAAFDARSPEGATPTGPALQGAISYVQSHLQQHPDHRGAVLLVTDGLPTDCVPVDVGDIAALAGAAVPSVLTYVIGVFEDEQAQLAQQNLDTIAVAGQTDSALIIKTSQDVAKELAASLAAIREHSLACEYSIPEPTEGEFQPDLVNVEVGLGEGTSETLGYVADAEDCAAAGGWHYDVDPASGGVPSEIRLCPQSCDAIQGNAQASVSIRLGCPTVVVK